MKDWTESMMILMCVCACVCDVKKSERAITEQSHNSKEEIVNLFCLRFFFEKKKHLYKHKTSTFDIPKIIFNVHILKYAL